MRAPNTGRSRFGCCTSRELRRADARGRLGSPAPCGQVSRMRVLSMTCALLLAVGVARAHPSAEFSLDARAQGWGAPSARWRPDRRPLPGIRPDSPGRSLSRRASSRGRRSIQEPAAGRTSRRLPPPTIMRPSASGWRSRAPGPGMRHPRRKTRRCASVRASISPAISGRGRRGSRWRSGSPTSVPRRPRGTTIPSRVTARRPWPMSMLDCSSRPGSRAGTFTRRPRAARRSARLRAPANRRGRTQSPQA